MDGLTTKSLHSKKAIFVTPYAFFHRFYFLLSKWLYTESHVRSIIPNTWRHICTIRKKIAHCQEMNGFLTSVVTSAVPYIIKMFTKISDSYFSTKTHNNSFKTLHLYILMVCKISRPKDSSVGVTIHNWQLVK